MEYSEDNDRIPISAGLLALSPVVVFLLLYVAVSFIVGDFYKMPISVALAAASIWATIIYSGHSLSHRLEIYSKSAGQSNILYMIWVFILAGAFASIAKQIGAVDATVGMIVNIFPPKFIVPMLFVAACFISFSIGTSVGTVVALIPLAVEMAQTTGGLISFFVAAVLGGAFFGDNLSFISDTTIASTRSQGCEMSDKFKANLRIALPAAVVTLCFYFTGIGDTSVSAPVSTVVNYWLMTPYMLVIIAAAIGINVCIVLVMGIILAMIIGCIFGQAPIDLATGMGEGIAGMGDLIIITLLASGMLGIIKAAGGIRFLLQALTSRLKGSRGTQAIIVLLVGLVNLCTANNTVAIITVGSIAREISRPFGIPPRKVASLLDSTSCIVQCLIPYGAQTLLATSLAGISPAAPFPYLYYPWALAIMVAISVVVKRR